MMMMMEEWEVNKEVYEWEQLGSISLCPLTSKSDVLILGCVSYHG